MLPPFLPPLGKVSYLPLWRSHRPWTPATRRSPEPSSRFPLPNCRPKRVFFRGAGAVFSFLGFFPARGTAGARGNDLPEVGVKSFKERVCVCASVWGLRCACARHRQPFAGGVPLAFGSGPPCGALFDLRPRKIMAAHGNGCAQRRNAGSIPRSLLLLLVWSGGAKGQCSAGRYLSNSYCYSCPTVRITR